MCRAYSFLCIQEWLLVIHGGPYAMLEIKQDSAACKISALNPVLSLRSEIAFSVCISQLRKWNLRHLFKNVHTAELRFRSIDSCNNTFCSFHPTVCPTPIPPYCRPQGWLGRATTIAKTSWVLGHHWGSPGISISLIIGRGCKDSRATSLTSG